MTTLEPLDSGSVYYMFFHLSGLVDLRILEAVPLASVNLRTLEWVGRVWT